MSYRADCLHVYSNEQKNFRARCREPELAEENASIDPPAGVKLSFSCCTVAAPGTGWRKTYLNVKVAARSAKHANYTATKKRSVVMTCAAPANTWCLRVSDVDEKGFLISLFTVWKKLFLKICNIRGDKKVQQLVPVPTRVCDTAQLSHGLVFQRTSINLEKKK